MKLLTGKNIFNALVEIIDEADETLIIVSPFIKLDNLKGDLKKFVEKLKEKSRIVELHTRPKGHDKGVEEIYTVEKLSKIFTGISPDHIYFNKNLHAKLYFNGKKALITSMNLLDYSIENSIEIGYLTDDIDECKKIKEQFYEKYLIEPYKEINDNIKNIKKNLNEQYDTLKYDYNKITIENKRDTNTAFVLECYIIIDNAMYYSFQFNIIAKDENTYLQIQQKYSDRLNIHNGFKSFSAKKENKTITLLSNNIDIDKKPDAVFNYDDIRYVFCNERTHAEFLAYLKKIMMALRDILYSKNNN
jgi:hypothetical protein